MATRPDLKSHVDATTTMMMMVMMMTADAVRVPWSIVAVDKKKLLLILLFLRFFLRARAFDNVETMTTVTVKASPLSSSSLPPAETTQATVTCSFSLGFFFLVSLAANKNITSKTNPTNEKDVDPVGFFFACARSSACVSSFSLT
jgi:hypothetical protein